MKKLKKLLSPILSVCIITACIGTFPSAAQSPSSVAIYSHSDMSLSGSAIIKGDAIITSGTLSGGNVLWSTGNIYMAPGVELKNNYSINRHLFKEYTDPVKKYVFSDYKAFPETTYFRKKSTQYKDGTKDVIVGHSHHSFSNGYTIDADSYIRNLEIANNLTAYINAPAGEVRIIRIDKMSVRGNLKVRGGGKVILYVDRLGNCSNGNFNASFYESDSPDKLTILIGKSSNDANFNNVYMSANLIYSGNKLSLNNTNIQGNLYIKGNLSLSGIANINGLTFAPNSITNISGSSLIEGMLITNNLNMSGACYIAYDTVSGLPSDIASHIGDKNDSQIANGGSTTTSRTTTTTAPSVTQPTTSTQPTNPDDPESPSDTVEITATIARRMSIRLENGQILKDGDKFTMPRYGTIRFQVCTNNWDTNSYTDNGQGIAGQKVYEFTHKKNKELYLRVDNNRYFAPVRFHFEKGDYQKLTGVDNVLSTPLESLSINFPLGATIKVKAYINNEVVDTHNLFIESNLEWYNWNY